jgi:hypothetical protein
MRGQTLMTNRTGDDEPVRIEIKLCERKWSNNHDYAKVIEVDPAEWAAMDPYEREQYIDERTAEFAIECFEPEYEILSAHDLNDPMQEE